MAHPTARGPVDVKGVTTRINRSDDRWCHAHPDREHMLESGATYERVARLDGRIESYTPECFAEEFGPRGAYGD